MGFWFWFGLVAVVISAVVFVITWLSDVNKQEDDFGDFR